MKKTLVWVMGIALVLTGWGCNSTNSDGTPDSIGIQTSESTDTAENTNREDTIEKSMVVRGETRLTKGDQIIVNGIFLNSEQVQMTSLTEEELAGKTVELKGDVVTHYCGKYDQCVGGEDGNYFKYVENLDYIKIVE